MVTGGVAPRSDRGRRLHPVVGMLLFIAVALGAWLLLNLRSPAAHSLGLDTVTQPVTQAVAPVTQPVTQAVAPVTQPVTQALAPVVQPVTQAVAPVVQPVTQALAPVLQPVTQVLAPVIDTVAPVARPVLSVVGPVVAPVAPVVNILTPPAPLPTPAPPSLIPPISETPNPPLTPGPEERAPVPGDRVDLIPPAIAFPAIVATDGPGPSPPAVDVPVSKTAPQPDPLPPDTPVPGEPMGPGIPFQAPSGGGGGPHGDGTGPVLGALPEPISPPASAWRRLGLLGASRPPSVVHLLLERPG